mgnify:CR=1 FL=1
MTGSSLSVILIDIALLGMMAMTAIAIARLRSLFAIVMLSGVYSLFSAAWFVVVDAVDVAFTEAAVGAGISTALILGGMLLTVRTAKQDDRVLKRFAPFLVCLVTGAVLVYATIDLPGFGDPNSPANIYLAKEYMERNTSDIGIPNVVTSILASYRGFDTFGETGVVFIAGLAVALLIGFGERSLAASLRNGKKPASTLAPDTSTGDHHVILRVMAKMLIPIIIMYAFYVQFHGDYSPGGGFQDFGDLGGFTDVFEDLFGDLLGGRRSGGRRRGRGQRGADLRYNLEIDLSDVITGLEPKIKIPKMRGCETCGSSGSLPRASALRRSGRASPAATPTPFRPPAARCLS